MDQEGRRTKMSMHSYPSAKEQGVYDVGQRVSSLRRARSRAR